MIIFTNLKEQDKKKRGVLQLPLEKKVLQFPRAFSLTQSISSSDAKIKILEI